MEELFEFAAFLPVISVLEVLCVACSILFMHFSAQHRNQKLSLGWYICGVIFGLWTVIIFLIKRKEFPGPKTKVCYQCGRKFPDTFQMCTNCLIDLPEIKAEEKEKQRKLATGFGIGLIITYVAALVVGIIMGATVTKSVFDTLSDIDYIERIAVEGVYYDKEGKCYNNDADVALYDKEGRVYNYTVEEIAAEEDELFTFDEYYFVRDDGEKYSIYDCYITADGWFYCDKGGFLEIFEEDTSSMTQEELDAYYQEQIDNCGEYKYYDMIYTDKDGNIYYRADEASWNEKGELITAENDVSK